MKKLLAIVFGFGLSLGASAALQAHSALLADFEDNAANASTGWGGSVVSSVDAVGSSVSPLPWMDSSGTAPGAGGTAFAGCLAGTLVADSGSNSPFARLALELTPGGSDYSGAGPYVNVDPWLAVRGLRFDYEASVPGIPYAVTFVQHGITGQHFYRYIFTPADTAWHTLNVYFPPFYFGGPIAIVSQATSGIGIDTTRFGAVVFQPVATASEHAFGLCVDNVTFDADVPVPTSTPTISSTRTATATFSTTGTASFTKTVTAFLDETSTDTRSPTFTPSVTPTFSSSMTITPVWDVTSTDTRTPSFSPTPLVTYDPSDSPTASPTSTPSPVVTIVSPLPTGTAAPNCLYNGAPALQVAGNNSYTTAPSTTSRSSMTQSLWVFGDADHLVMSGFENRALVWDPWPSADGAPADGVIGQADFNSSIRFSAVPCGPVSADRVYISSGGAVEGSHIWLGDNQNGRVLRFSSALASSGTAADLVIGTSGLTTPCTSTVSASNMADPIGVWSDGLKMIVADNANHRVLIWNSLPTITGQAADLVLGQADFNSRSKNRCNCSSAGANTLGNPWGVWSDGDRVAVADRGNARVLLWDHWPSSNGQAADRVLGQPDFVSTLSNQGGAADARGFYGPTGIGGGNGLLAVSDEYNNRVLVWDLWPSTNDQAATTVLGQPDFSSTLARSGSSGLSSPEGLFVQGSSIWVVNAYGAFRYGCPMGTPSPVLSPSSTPQLTAAGTTAPSFTSTATPTVGSGSPLPTLTRSATVTPSFSMTATCSPTLGTGSPLPSSTRSATMTPSPSTTATESETPSLASPFSATPTQVLSAGNALPIIPTTPGQAAQVVPVRNPSAPTAAAPLTLYFASNGSHPSARLLLGSSSGALVASLPCLVCVGPTLSFSWDGSGVANGLYYAAVDLGDGIPQGFFPLMVLR